MNIGRSTLTWGDTVREAVTTITQRPLRTLLTSIGTILGVAAYVATTGLAETARAQVSATFDALKATQVIIQDATPDGTNPFPSDTTSRLEQLNGINHAGIYYTLPDNGTLQPRATLTRPTRPTAPIPVIAADPGAIHAALPTLTTGRLYDTFHQTRHEHVAILGRAAAQQLGITRIDNQPAVFLADTPYTVLGIIDDVARNPDLLLAIIIPTATAEHDYPNTTSATYQVLIDAQPGAAQLAGRQAPLALRPDNPNRLQALVPPDPKRLRTQVSNDITNLLYALSYLSLLIGTVAITNATLLSTIERTPEIGLRRALGATRSHIRRQITIETAITGTLAATIGTLTGITAVIATSLTRHWTTTINPTTPLIAPLIGLATGTLAGIIPAHKATKTPPATTLR